MNKNEIIEELYRENRFDQLLKNIIKEQLNYFDDLKSELFVFLLEMQEDKLQQLYNNKQLDFYITRVIINWFNSNTSPFYCRYRKFESKLNLNITEEYINNIPAIQDKSLEELLQFLEQEIEQLQYSNNITEVTDYKILKKWLELGKIKEVSQYFNINTNYISKRLTKTKELLKDKLEKWKLSQ